MISVYLDKSAAIRSRMIISAYVYSLNIHVILVAIIIIKIKKYSMERIKMDDAWIVWR